VLAIYLFSNIWTHYHYILLEGLDRVWAVAGLVLLENSMVLAFGIIFVPRWGAIGMAVAYLLASIVVPAWLLPRILGGRLTKLREAQRRMHMFKDSGRSSKSEEVMTNHA
jgi:O-antigen/teichoic acid export membrane protein